MTAKKIKNILDLSSIEVVRFFMSSESFSTVNLPPYFNFSAVLEYVETALKNDNLNSCKCQNPQLFDNVNYSLVTNKDGRLAYRTFQITNPFFYYLIVKTIANSWDEIKSCFASYQSSMIEVVSIPKPKDKNQSTLAGTNIHQWWEKLEQRSIELSLQYRYMLVTDISNCYSSIYTHSIPWALLGREAAKQNRSLELFPNQLDKLIQSMQSGQTNGIPQGSTLYDFIAEIVLGYADKLLFDRLQKNVSDYKILRYRDDYRIFTNSKESSEIIIKELQLVLASLNFQINSSKTFITDCLIEGSIKKDKLYYLSNVPIEKNGKTLFSTYQKELLYILVLAKKFPNSGIICTLLSSFYKRLEKRKRLTRENPHVLIAIVCEIAMNCPRTYNWVIAILSLLFTFLKNKQEIEELSKQIFIKFSQLPNIGYLQIWLQRLLLPLGISTINYTEGLCKLVAGEDYSIWNLSWIKPNKCADFPLGSICDKNTIQQLSNRINADEVAVFNNY